jgi:hypothetical protein
MKALQWVQSLVELSVDQKGRCLAALLVDKKAVGMASMWVDCLVVLPVALMEMWAMIQA